MSKPIFKIDYDRLIILSLPTFLRKIGVVSFLSSLNTAIKSVYANFTDNQNSNIYKLAHNGQVCYLRAALNDSFDPSLRRIYITEGNKFNRVYIYTNAENQPRYLGKMYLRTSLDYGDTGVDFRVVVPKDFDLTNNIYQLSAMIDFYKLASKRYKIETDE